MSTMSHVNDAFSAFNELYSIVSGMPMTGYAPASANPNDAAAAVLSAEIGNVILTYKTSIRRVLSKLSESQINQLNIQSISRVFSEDYKTTLLKMITEKV